MTAALDYFSPIDSLVSEALTEFAEVTALVPTQLIQVGDLDSDVRGDLSQSGAAVWIQIIQRPSRPDMVRSNTAAWFEITYSVKFGHRGTKVERLNQIRTAIFRGLMRLHDLKEADGVTPITQPAPFHIVSVLVTGTDPGREPIDDPEELDDVCDVTVSAWIAHADLRAAAEAPSGSAPTVVSVSAAFDSASTAAVQGKVTDLGGATRLIEVGVCWATHATPTTADFKTAIASGVTPGILPLTFGAAAAMIGLTPGTTYYARLYAVTAGGTGYGEDIQVDYPFAEPISFTYSADNNRLLGTFNRTLQTSSTIPNAGWSAVVPAAWEWAPRWTMCFTGEIGAASGTTLHWNGGVDAESVDDVVVKHTTPDASFADEWGVPVPAFECSNVTIEEI